MKGLLLVLSMVFLTQAAFAQRNPRLRQLEQKVQQLESKLDQVVYDQDDMEQQIRRIKRQLRNGGGGGGGGRLSCNWSGRKWLSHGWDGGCAWNTGAFVHCQNGKVTQISFEEAGNCRTNRN